MCLGYQIFEISRISSYFESIIFLRGIDCGTTNVSEEDLAMRLMAASKDKFHPSKYNLFGNNCRNFCDFLIFDVLKPSKKENGNIEKMAYFL